MIVLVNDRERKVLDWARIFGLVATVLTWGCIAADRIARHDDRPVSLPRVVMVGSDEPGPMSHPPGTQTLTCNGTEMACEMHGRVTRCWCTQTPR